MTVFPYTLADRDAPRLGLIVLQTDETIEPDMRRLLPKAAELHVTRVPSGLEVTTETLGEMAHHITKAAALLPRAQDYDAVGYGCTSGSAVIGPDKVADLVRKGARAQAVSEPLSALTAACRHLDVARLAFLSPYVETVSTRLRERMKDRGIETPVFGSFDEAEEAKVVRISESSVFDAAVSLCDGQDVDAVFLSCTNLRTLDVIRDLESRLDLAVLSSNQVLAWHMCGLAGIATETGAFGRLFHDYRAVNRHLP